jgi:Tol biopolymer transport system component
MFIYSFDGSSSIPLGQGRSPDCSPDGTLIAYSDAYACEVWAMSADGSRRTLVADLTRPGVPDCYPASLTTSPGPVWSPDGREVAVMAFDSLYVMNADGTSLRVISKKGSLMGVTWRPVP